MRAERVGSAVAALGMLVIAMGLAAPAANAAVCDPATSTCQIGDTGPGGGTIVYDAGSVQPWGRYLEVAPATWVKNADDALAIWCDNDQAGYANRLKTRNAIGTGEANTKLIIKSCGKKSAAGVAAAYRGGGLSDWFLPSRAELNQMYLQRTRVGGIEGEQMFWSSSQARKRTPVADLPDGQPTGRSPRGVPQRQATARRLPVSAWAQDFMTGKRQPLWKWGAGAFNVRPMRAF